MGRTFPPPLFYPKEVSDPFTLPNIRWLHFTLLTLSSSFYLHIIRLTLLSVKQNKFSDYTAFSEDFLMFQLKVNILHFLFYGILKQFVVLSLWGRYFFHVDPGYWFPACPGISDTKAFAITDPESYAHDAFLDLLTDAFYLAHPVQIFLGAVSVEHIDDSINSCWSWALCAIKGEIPPSAATMTIVETKVSIEKDSQPGFGRLLVEKAFLWNLIRKEKITRTTGPALH